MSDTSKGKPHHQHKPRGQSLVEFVLILPILLLLVLGAIDFGRLFSTKIALTNAAREGANYLALNPDDAKGDLFVGTKNAATQESNILTITNDDIAPDCEIRDSNNHCQRGTQVSVITSANVDLIFGPILQFFGVPGGTIQLSSTVRMMAQ